MLSEIVEVCSRILAGTLFGYVIATWVESFVHEHVSDARPSRVRVWDQYPRLSAPFKRAHYSHHVVHHQRTYRHDHVTQFRSPQERACVDAELEERGRHGRLIRQANYSMRLGGSGALAFIAPLVPGIVLIDAILGHWSLVGAIPLLSAPPILSHFVHPYIHRTYLDAQRDAPRLVAWFISTRYGQAVVRNHWMHHRYRACYNLLLGGDVLRGVSRSPSPRDMARMVEIGLLRTDGGRNEGGSP